MSSSNQAPLPEGLAEHVRGCPVCSALMGEAAKMALPQDFSPGLAKTILLRMHQDLKPVRPQPGPLVFSLLFFALTILVALSIGVGKGASGFELMTTVQRVSIFSTWTVMALFAATMAARSMRPAGGRLWSWPLAIAAIVIPEFTFLLVFRDFDVGHFVPAGLLCLATGLGFGIPTTWLAWRIINRGFVVEPVAAATLAGLVGGLSGLGLLEIHCHLLTFPHTAVWHVAVVAIAMGGAASIARLRTA